MKFSQDISSEITRIAVPKLWTVPEIMQHAIRIDKMFEEADKYAATNEYDHRMIAAQVEQKRFADEIYKRLLTMPAVWESVIQSIQETCVNEEEIAAAFIDDLQETARQHARNTAAAREAAASK